MNLEEAQAKAEELVKLTAQQKEVSNKIKLLKGELLEFAELEAWTDHVFTMDNGFVEIATNTKYKLVDIPSEFKVPSDVAAQDTAQKAFEAKIVLSKEGKQMFKENHPSIVKLMVPELKRTLKVTVDSQQS